MGKNSMKDKRMRLTALLLAAMLVTTPANAYWRWNYDWKTLIQVCANTTAASGVEGAHNATLSEQKKNRNALPSTLPLSM